MKNPGTYHVVANMDSFVASSEYREENEPISGARNAGNLMSPALADEEDAPSNVSTDPTPGADDPNVVILRVFEEPPRKVSSEIGRAHV